MQISSDNQVESEAAVLERIQRRGVRLNIIIMGLVLGVAGGLILFLGTQLSLAVSGEHAGRYLNLLGVFLPGYSATPTGALAGLFWGFVFGGFSGSFAYWLYARNIDRRIAEMTLLAEDANEVTDRATLRLSGNSLGIAFGLLAALQLFVTTMWLVVRGTAGDSEHAALLAEYLPGYEVGLMGALYGCAELFVFTYVAASIFAGVYNFVAARGQGTRT